MKAVLEALGRVEEFLLATIMIVMTVLFSGSVLVRALSDELFRQIAWVDEATRYLMVWMVFLGLGLALQRGRHIAMGSLLERLPQWPQTVVHKLIDAAGLFFSGFVAWFGTDIALLVLRSGQASPTLGVTTALLYAALPVGFALLAIRYLASLFGVFDRWAATSPADAH
ncbi:TRAP transporter small permease [Jiella pelagia]|uniref:TRAP transporter small permease protein n=1 Tax=Jiella pelagia TaxID=2986949 RepID=A0ABY7C0X1_9HYPH|nr:TRAP transporter small permease [Jiella pelagia]WAP69734.1 TRAP transporter small permease [Jiella pelagia]